MADSSRPSAVTPVSDEVITQIHFDTLWETAQDALGLYAGQRWSARGEADPGITLMQAFAYGVSDVSYRHTLPLKDLLTRPNIPKAEGLSLDHQDGIFAHEFGPEWALTSSPVTLADYRRAILDLTVNVGSDLVFCFRDVQIALQPVSDSYGYTYDEAKYAIQFISATTPEASRYRVPGRYRLWVTRSARVSQDAANVALEAYLKTHRNLCEWEIVPEPFVKVKSSKPQVYFILDDDLMGSAINLAVAQAIQAINQALLPAPVRQSAAARLDGGERAEQVYNGPRLEHGWVAQLPPERPVTGGALSAYTVSVHALSAAVVGVVPGIKGIEWPGGADIQVSEGMQHQLWVTVANKEILDTQAGDRIKVFKRGQDIPLNWAVVAEVYETLQHTASLATPDKLRQVAYGRYRNPGFYRSVGASLPPVYGLQQGTDDLSQDARMLLQFLRPFEQLLASSADQVSKLPGILAFDGRRTDAMVWGTYSLPRQDEDPLTWEQLHEMYSQDDLIRMSWLSLNLSHDREKELAILNYLLGYFGEQRAAQALVGVSGDKSDEFLPVQQGFLRQVTRLAYERAAISVSRISALQRKIAARLGVGAALFDESLQKPDGQFPGDDLPFYVIEHHELLPEAAAPSQITTDWPQNQTVTVLQGKIETRKSTGLLTLSLSNATGLKPGQLIELQGTPSGKNQDPMEPLASIVLHTVNDNEVTIVLKEHIRLMNTLPQLDNNTNTWRWRLSQTWLQSVVIDLAYYYPFSKGDPMVTLDATQSFPAGLKKGQRLVLRPKARWQRWPTTKELTDAQSYNDIVVEVVESDPIRGTVKVKWVKQITAKSEAEIKKGKPAPPVDLQVSNDDNPQWPESGNINSHYAWSVPYSSDNFSFTLSVVLNRKWLTENGNTGEMSQWIEQIVREEMPSHLNLQLHWLTDFHGFAQQYRSWQRSDRPVGDQSFELLRMLGIGERPVDQRTGIGFVRVASKTESTKEETALKDKDNNLKESILRRYSVIYVKQSQ